MFTKFWKVSDRERTWIACTIYMIPPKKVEWLGQVELHNIFIMSNTQCQSQNWAKVSQMTSKINNQFKQCTKSLACN